MAKAWAALAAGLVFSACAPVDVGFGEAVRQTYQQQIVDPDPTYAEGKPLLGSGERAAKAVQRYEAGQVAKPSNVGTTSGTGSSSGPN